MNRIILSPVILCICIGTSSGAGTTPPPKKTPDFSSIQNIKKKKETFFEFMLPLIQKANQDIAKQRARLLKVISTTAKKLPLSQSDQQWLKSLAKSYRLGHLNMKALANQKALLKRVQILPASLVLAQAAIESGYGSSRFAREINNYFGIWCFKKGCGEVPRRRRKGASHEVKRFSSALASVKDYMRNLNSHPAFKRFRENRSKMSTKLNAIALAKDLQKYSQKGDRYISDVQSLIKSNQLDRYPSLPN